ncbi:MAG: Yga2E [Anaerolineaceae bacterium]|nr:MAG: Yga2E [Anaerolineaceae bacterium]
MKPNSKFLNLPKNFWASVRLISQEVGYTEKSTSQIKIPSLDEIQSKLAKFEIEFSRLQSQKTVNGNFGQILQGYFIYRADIINTFVEPRLMNVTEARKVFKKFYKDLQPSCPIPMNKQKGKMKTPAYLTGLVNMLVEANANGLPCDYDPHQLTIITEDYLPVRTLARRVDGAFPSSVNPIAIWEIKEYYYTTTFGSRVADGIYESLLDGLELEELREHEGVDIKHYLIVDAHDTWWKQGKSYLCRIIDMLHMGYIDEVLFGREVTERLPDLVSEWAEIYKSR